LKTQKKYFATSPPAIVDAAIKKPDVILKRPAGSREPFPEDAHLPKDLPPGRLRTNAKRRGTSPKKARPNKAVATKHGDKAARKAAAAFELEQRRRDSEQKKLDAAEAKRGAQR
jgi:colicin import membrane protein